MTTMPIHLAFFVVAVFTFTLAQTFDETGVPRCPQSCTCSPYLKRVSCIGRGLRKIPSDIPHMVSELYLSKNLLTAIPDRAFDGLSNLTTLSLKQNLINSIDKDAFVGLGSLRVLYLTHNKLTDLSAETFHNLHSLKDLYLTQNLLKTVPDLKYASSLTKLAIDNNKLKSALFGPGFANLTSLSSLGLANNPTLSEICDEDFQFLPKSIRIINLSRCGLKKLERKVLSFPHLQSLSLSYNQWWNVTFAQTIINSLSNCKELASLDLSGTIRGSMLPVDFFHNFSAVPLKTLKLANIAVNEINGSVFAYLKMLVNLDLSKGELSTVAGEISSMPKLQRLMLAKNKKLTSIPNLLLPSLTFLDITGCASIVELTENIFANVPSLERLLLSDCKIRTIAKGSFTGLRKLDTLDISGNAIGGSNLPAKIFSPLYNLRRLDLSRNNMGIILQEFKLFEDLVHLELLNLSDNKCSALPIRIFNALVSLRQLDLSKNHLGESVIGPVSGGQLFSGLEAVKWVDLSSNAISALPSGLFDSMFALRAASLAGNRLTEWNGTMFNFTRGNLTTVDFSSNRISIVTQPMIEGLPWSHNLEINLLGNPFACWCDLVWFRRWIAADVNITERRLYGLSKYKCNSPASMAGHPLIDFDPDSIESVCRPPPWLIISIVGALGSAIVVVGSFSVAYRNRWWLRLRLYYVGKKFRRQPMQNGYQNIEESTEVEYDVFVSYFNEDDSGEWVREVLVPTLKRTVWPTSASLNADAVAGQSADVAVLVNDGADDPARFFLGRYCVFHEDEDIPFGETVIGAIDEAMRRSKKVLIVASEKYAADARRRFEINMAVVHGFDRVVLVLWKDESVGPRLPRVLHPLLDPHLRALVWTPESSDGKELFWRRLDEELARIVD